GGCRAPWTEGLRSGRRCSAACCSWVPSGATSWSAGGAEPERSRPSCYARGRVTSTERERQIPAPGQAPLPAPNAAALLRRNALDHTIAHRPAVRFEDKLWTHGEYVANARRWANLFLAHKPDGPFHVGVLLDNTPEYLFAFGGAALAGATIVGLNHTRRGDNLLRDHEHTDVALLVTAPRPPQ